MHGPCQREVGRADYRHRDVRAAAYDARYQRTIKTAKQKSCVEVIDLSDAARAKFRAAAAPMIDNWIAAREKLGIEARAMYELAKTVK